jgi:hypothetical protein
MFLCEQMYWNRGRTYASWKCNSLKKIISWEANSRPLFKKLLAFYVTLRFIALYTRARLWSLSLTKWNQSTPSHPIPLRFILILSFHLRLPLPSSLFPTGLPIKNLTKVQLYQINNWTQSLSEVGVKLMKLFRSYLTCSVQSCCIWINTRSS